MKSDSGQPRKRLESGNEVITHKAEKTPRAGQGDGNAGCAGLKLFSRLYSLTKIPINYAGEQSQWLPYTVHNEFCRFMEFLSWNNFLYLNFYVYTIHLKAYLNSDCEQGPCLYLLSHAHQLPSSSINVYMRTVLIILMKHYIKATECGSVFLFPRGAANHLWWNFSIISWQENSHSFSAKVTELLDNSPVSTRDK